MKTKIESIEEKVETCAHCGAENPPGLLLCLACGREPSSGRDLFTPPDIPIPDQEVYLPLAAPSYDLSITIPDPIQVPDPLPVATLEEFIAPPPQPHPKPSVIHRDPPKPPRAMVPLLSPWPRWTIGLLGLAALMFLSLGAVGSFVTLNLPGGICLGSLGLTIAVVWLGIILAHRGESYNQTTGARRQLVKTLGQRLFEMTPGPAREQRAQLPAIQIPPLTRAASELIYLSSAGDRPQQLAQLFLGTMCALVAGNNLELATQTYDVLTANLLRSRVETVKRTVVSRRALYVGAGYLENLIIEQLRRSPTTSIRDLAISVLRQAGADLTERISTQIAELPSSPEGEASDLDAQVAALYEFCDEFKALNPDLYQQLTQEVGEAIGSLTRTPRRRSR